MVTDVMVDTERSFLINFVIFEEECHRQSIRWGGRHERDSEIVRRYFGIHRSTMNLPQLGRHYGLTRERIRQIKVRILAELHQMLSGVSQKNPLRQYSGALSSQYQNFREKVIQEKHIILRSNVSLSLAQEDTHVPHLNLLMGMLGFEYASCHGHDMYYDGVVLNQGIVFKLISAVYAMMRREIYPMEASALVDRLREADRNQSPDKTAISDILNEFPDYEYVTVNGRSGYQLCLDKLPSVEFTGIRILRDYGRPMYYKDLVREMNRQLAIYGSEKKVGYESLQMQFSSSAHVAAISRTGIWALVEWRQETDSIKRLIERTMRSSGNAMTATEIYDVVKTRREDVRRSTVVTLLSKYKDVFVSLKSGKFALMEWRIDSKQLRPVVHKREFRDDAAVMQAMIRIVHRHKKNVFTKGWLRAELKAEGYEFSNNVFYGRILRYPVLEKVGYSQSNIRLKADAGSAMIDKFLASKETLESRIARHVQRILVEHHGVAKLADVVSQIARETGCQRGSVYRSVTVKGFKKRVVDGETVIMAAPEAEH
ncbi:MAG: hypothetical protein KFH87_08840 [Bacteroidetes bacterium]|nr:hypothetical protein [Bacteroidota bacterium]